MKLTSESRFFIAVAAFLGATAVMFAAYASHGLSSWATPTQVMQVQLAAQFQLFHAITLLAVTTLQAICSIRLLSISLRLFVAGIVCFSGSLYYLVFIGSKSLVLITPLGGLLLISAWLCVVIAMLFKQK